MRIKNFLFVFSFIFLVGCSSNDTNEIRIAQHYGFQYSPLYVANELGILNKNLPNAKIKLQNLTGGPAISEALVGGHLDMACMGIPPALIAMDKGADFKIAFGISLLPAQIMVMDKNIKSLADIKPTDKIATPGVGSLQEIMLSIAAKDILSDAHRFDKNIITMKNPEAFNALINNTDIVAHFASMPYIAKELEHGAISILDVKDINLRTSIVCVATKDFYENRRDDYNKIAKSIQESINLINKKDKKALEIISKIEKINDIQKTSGYLDNPKSEFLSKVYGVKRLYEHMLENGYIKNSTDIKNYFWDESMIGK